MIKWFVGIIMGMFGVIFVNITLGGNYMFLNWGCVFIILISLVIIIFSIIEEKQKKT